MTLNIKHHSDELSTTGQITVEDIPRIKALGFRSIIINRPDEEAGGLHLTSEEVARAGAQIGLAVEYLPVIPNQITDAQVAAFGNLLEKLPSPALAYCATGNRASSLCQRSAFTGQTRIGIYRPPEPVGGASQDRHISASP